MQIYQILEIITILLKKHKEQKTYLIIYIFKLLLYINHKKGNYGYLF